MIQGDVTDEFQAWVFGFSLFMMLSALLGCACGCRKNSKHKEDWLGGQEGKMKPLHTGLNGDDERIARLDGEQNRTLFEVKNSGNTANRSLPDIPTNDSRDGETPWDPNQATATSDNCSELYATVGDAPSIDVTDRPNSKKRQAPSAPSTENSQSEATPPALAHQYAKLSHPYARVKPPPPKNDIPHHASSSTVTQPSLELESSENTPGVHGGSETTLSSSPEQPVPPPRARRSSSHSNLYRTPSGNSTLPSGSSSSSSSSSKVADTIAAAPAILGQISASQELPYITLPIPDSSARLHNSVPSDLPARSGVAGESIPEIPTNPVDQVGNSNGAGHFSGDSQDSSKGYTSISVREPLATIRAQLSGQPRRMDPHYATVSDDSDEMYAAIEDRSGSDTYAQIIPVPPSVDSLRTRVAENHSRQASSSSAASSIANMGSPKPEKRQANSPLPPPPLVPPPPSSPPANSTSALPPASIEELYAKVIKKKSSNPIVEPPPSPPQLPETDPPMGNVSNSGYESLNASTSGGVEPGYAQVQPINKKKTSVDLGYEVVRNNPTTSTTDVPPSLVQEHGYESVASPHQTSPVQFGYEQIQSAKENDSNYNSSDPGYELVRNPVSRNISQRSVEPNYEELSERLITEPNYENLNGEPGYEPLTNERHSEEPNYESVGGPTEPPYEQLGTTKVEALYASVNRSTKKKPIE